MRQFFLGLPHDLWEAAQLDGAGHLCFLWSIALPLSRAPLITIALFHFVTSWNALSGNLQAALTSLTDQFNSSQSTVYVNLVAKGAYTDLNKAVLTGLAAGQAPDMAQCIEIDAAKYNSSKALADLTPYINAADGFSSGDLKDIFPVMLNAAKIGGTYYQFPFNKSTTVIYYNQDMFTAKGINSPPATWDEFITDT